MEKLSITTLRKQLYSVIDKVLETGTQVEIERHGRTVVIAPAAPTGSKLERLPRRRGIVGDPNELVNESVGEWGEHENLNSST